MAFNLTTFMCQFSLNLGTSNSWNPQGLSRDVMGLLYLFFFLRLLSIILSQFSLPHFMVALTSLRYKEKNVMKVIRHIFRINACSCNSVSPVDCCPHAIN